jgi:YidC/Oxa1 family membrane protein insertase
MFDVFFQSAAWLIDTFYDWVGEYTIAIAMVSVAIMLLITPLTLKSTKGMLEMQRLQPEMKRLQNEHRGDRQQLNQEMMKLYQEHKVNPLASCLPLLAQMPVFIIMFQVLSGLTRKGDDGTFNPKYISEDTALYQSLDKATEMLSFGLDLAITPAQAMGDDFVRGLPYALLIVALGGLFFVQQRMVASRAVSPTMSPMQAKIMQYLPVAFAVFQVFLPTSLVAYYMVQAIFRIVQQGYITRRFYGENGLGREAQEASAKAREIGKDDDAKASKQKNEQKQAPTPIQSKRVTPGKNRPTPSGRPARPVPPSKRNK